MSSPRSPERPSGAFGWLRKIDDVVFAVEQTIVATFLIAITTTVFLDVVYRRLVAPDSKLGDLIARVAGVTDEGARGTIDAYVAPAIGAIAGVLALWFGFWTLERNRAQRAAAASGATAKAPGVVRPLLFAVATAAVLAAFAFAMAQPSIESKYVYLFLYFACAGAYGVHLVRRRPSGWTIKLGGLALVVTPLFVFVATRYFPRGYSWSKELSLMMLLWVGFLGASVCAHEGKHLRLEALERTVPPAALKWVRASGALVTAAFCAFMAVLGYVYVFGSETGALALGGTFEQTQLPDWIATVAVPVAFGLTTLRFVAVAIAAVLGGSYGRAPEDESLAAAKQLASEAAGDSR